MFKKLKSIIKISKKSSIFALCSKNRFFEGFSGFYGYIFMINPIFVHKTNQIIDCQLKPIIKNERISKTWRLCPQNLFFEGFLGSKTKSTGYQAMKFHRYNIYNTLRHDSVSKMQTNFSVLCYGHLNIEKTIFWCFLKEKISTFPQKRCKIVKKTQIHHQNL